MEGKFVSVFVLLSTLLIGCDGGSQPQTDACITVDVTADYPEKELYIQDMADVEYVPLETTDTFITHGIVKGVSKSLIVTTNWGGSGDIFLFDRSTGKGIRKINHKGQSGQEYVSATDVLPDEERNELFVMDYSARKILVYDLEGHFKRTFKTLDSTYYTEVLNYDKAHLLCYKQPAEGDNERASHILISKEDGSLVKEISIPFRKLATPVFTQGELSITPIYYLTVPAQADYILTKTSADTIYRYASDGVLAPFIARTPSIHEMETQVFLYPTWVTDRYIFMRTQKKEVDLKTFKGFPSTDLVYDKQDRSISQSRLGFRDFEDKWFDLSSQPLNPEVPFCQSLAADELVEANKEGKLQGKLKEIVDKMDEDDNPVIVIIRCKSPRP